MGPDSLFEPSLSVVISAVGGGMDLESIIEAVNRVLKKRPTTGELILIGSVDERHQESLQASGVIVIGSGGGNTNVIAQALERARGDRIVLMTEIHRYHLSDVDGLLDVLDSGAGLVVGSRVTGSGLPPLEQHLSIPIFSTVLRWRYGLRLSDPASGLIAFRRSLLDGIELAGLKPPVTLELIRAATEWDHSIRQVSVSYRAASNRDEARTPNINYLRQSFRALPPDVFALPGGGSVLIGLALLAATVMDIPVGGVDGPLSHPFRATLIGGLLAIGGTQIVGLGVFARLRLSPNGRHGNLVTDRMVEYLSTGWALGLGMAILSIGFAYGIYLLSIWLDIGVSAQPAYTADLLAGILLVLGGQLTASSIYLNSLSPTQTA